MKWQECRPENSRIISRGLSSWRHSGYKMRQDIFKTEKLLLREKRMNVCHRKLNGFEGSKRLKQVLFTGNRRREIVWKQLHMIKHVQLRMLPELLRRLQKLLQKHKLKLLLRHRLRLMHKHRHRLHRQQHRLDSWINTLRLSDSRTFLQAGRPIKNLLVVILWVP